MADATTASLTANHVDHQRAIELLAGGELRAGAHLLGAIAARTRDDELRSKSLHSLAQVLEHLGQPQEAYRLWYDLAHKPPPRRNHYDLSARMQVMRVFDDLGLRVRPPDFPPRVQVEVTNRCNLKCVMCTRNQMRRPLGVLSIDHLRKIADECAAEPGAVLLLFFLGEPLLHPGLEEMVAYLASVKDCSDPPLSFGIQTNGMLLTPERARALVDAGLRSFHFSVDGLAGDLERVRPGAEHAVVERNILNLLALRAERGLDNLLIEISKLCDDRDADEVKRFLDCWEGKVDRVHLLEITKVPGNSYLDADGNLRPIECCEQTAARAYCGQGQRLLVHADGRYAFCHGDVNGEIELGHVAERSIREVWNSPEIDSVRARVRAADYAGLSPCENCPQSRARLAGPR